MTPTRQSERDRAERCFAVARSATFAGERDNAIALGSRIAQAAGLSLDLFDIPGRVRSATCATFDNAFAHATEALARQHDVLRARNEQIARAQAAFERERAEEIRRAGGIA